MKELVDLIWNASLTELLISILFGFALVGVGYWLLWKWLLSKIED